MGGLGLIPIPSVQSTWQSRNETMEVLVSFPDHLYGPHKVSAIGSNYYAYIEAHF